jgi:hypothetical protein
VRQAAACFDHLAHGRIEGRRVSMAPLGLGGACAANAAIEEISEEAHRHPSAQTTVLPSPTASIDGGEGFCRR